jgi:hypothetical protein
MDLDPERQMGFFIMEKWLDVKGYEDLYKVSSNGLIKRKSCIIINKNAVKCKYKERSISPENVKGYLRCTLSKNNIQKKIFVHRLVAENFIDNPHKKRCVNHIDGNKLNNSISNLEWVTHSENEIHSYNVLNKKNHNRKLSQEDVDDIRANCLIGVNGNVSFFCKKYNVSRYCIYDILKNKNYVKRT